MADVTSHTERMKDHLGDAAEKARETGSTFRDKASDVMQNIKDAGSEAARAVSRGLSNMGDTASEYWQKSREGLQRAGETMQHGIESWPFSSVLAAAGVGFLLGIIWMRR